MKSTFPFPDPWLREEYPALWEIAATQDVKERNGLKPSQLENEAMVVMHELWLARQNARGVMESPCALRDCAGLTNDGLCPNGYGRSCESTDPRLSEGTCTDCKAQDGPCWCGTTLGCIC